MIDSAAHWDLRICGPTVPGGIAAGQSIVAAVKRKKIYCKASAYQ
jgi:hypothetical protein